MKALFYSPYLDILGGGENHLLQFAHCLSSRYQIYLVWKDSQMLSKISHRFNLDLSSFIVLPFLPPRFHLKQFDLLFFVSDGSIPFLPVSKSVLFFMSPFMGVNGGSLTNRFKLKFIRHIVCNSYYTKKFIDPEFHLNSQVIYPSVDLPSPNLTSKQDLILSVGRFSRTLHDKNQAALIDAFVKIEPQLPNWQLVLVGGTEKGSQTVLNQLVKKTTGHRISIKTDLSSPQLHQLYTQAKLYWHATGFGIDLKAHPQKAEHFGISILEAMSFGAVPLVYNAGGPTEIVTPESGFIWNNINNLQSQTLNLINHPQTWSTYSSAAVHRAGYFSQSKLCQDLNELVNR